MNLGNLSGEVWVFGGPYSNYQALQALKAFADENRVSASNIICTGDTVAYCGQPKECLELLMDWQIPVVLGNCEESLATQANDCGCGFEEGSSCSILSNAWYSFSQSKLADRHRRWMAELPRKIDFNLGELRFLCVHGSTDSINEFVFASTPAELKQKQVKRAGVDAIIGGHCGLPFGHQLEQGAWLNAGTIGMPANDGTSRVWFMRLRESARGVLVSWHPLTYDTEGAQVSMRNQNLPEAYAQTLESGLWPGLDVLPENEKSKTGQRLTLDTLLIAKTQDSS